MSSRSARTGLFCAILIVASCRAQPSEPHFPTAEREVAPIVGGAFSTEGARDRAGEAEEVMQLAGVKPGMSVADVGAGEGYYTVRLARVVGSKGRVLAEDIMSDVRDELSDRVQRESLDNVAVKLGAPDNPMLPSASFDRVFLLHMYHEVQSPYAFLWHLTHPVKHHGMPPAQLKCEFASLNMQPVRFNVLSGGDVYLMAFRVAGERPAPA